MPACSVCGRMMGWCHGYRSRTNRDATVCSDCHREQYAPPRTNGKTATYEDLSLFAGSAEQ